MNWIYKKTVITLAAVGGLVGFAHADTQQLEQAVREQIKTSPVVNISLEWYGEKTTHCEGVLIGQGDKVATVKECFENGRASLKQVTLFFSNKKTAVGNRNTVDVHNDMAFIRVNPQVTQGVKTVQVGLVPADQSLQEYYGRGVGAELMSFMMQKGIFPTRNRCRIGASSWRGKPQLKLGTPFFWNGKVVALFKEVPRRISVSLFGGISEGALRLFRR